MQFNAGPHIGAQYYEQILFFRNKESLQNFMSGTIEFGGQVNATVATAGVAVTPSYNADIALFTNIGGGLMLETSIGGHQYTFKALKD